MEWEFSNQCLHDLELFRHEREFILQLEGKIKEIENANSIEDIPGLKNIRGRKVFYRFKITSGRMIYRIGLKVLHNKVWVTVMDTYKKRFYDRI